MGPDSEGNGTVMVRMQRSYLTGVVRLVAAMALIASLTGCSSWAHYIVVLDCDGPLSPDYSCAVVREPGAPMTIRVSTETKVILFESPRNPTGDLRVGDKMRDDCMILDSNNWRCGDRMGLLDRSRMTTEEGMSNGRYYRMVVGGMLPDIYYSSVSGVAAALVVMGLIDANTAMPFWRFCWRLGVSPGTVDTVATSVAVVVLLLGLLAPRR